MSFTSINKYIVTILFIFIISCKPSLFERANEKGDVKYNYNDLEKKYSFDFSNNLEFADDVVDFYSQSLINYNLLNDNLKKVKIKNYESKLGDNIPINVINIDKFFYSLNYKGDLLKFNEKGKLLKKYEIKEDIKNKIPTSFLLIKDEFVIAYKSGEILKTDKAGNIKWIFKKNKLLNSPIKYYEGNLIILYFDEIIFLSLFDGEIIFQENYPSNNVIQSSGGKIVNYFNLIYFLLPNSELNIVDTFIFEEHITKLNSKKFLTTLNNLNDNIHIHGNYFVYLDNGNSIYTYDIVNEKFLLSDFKLNRITSSIFFNNSLITKNDNDIEFYNIINGKLFNGISIKGVLKKKSKLIKAIINNKDLNLFTNQGEVIILDKKLNIKNIVDLNINKINSINNYQNQLYFLSEDGISYVLK